ncbi:MAG: hypothetical protein JXA17_06910, partial [Dehalococcoidales bacterium]|nr:hypothetical protein [Dehalococcoidales bacterium]
MKKLILGGLVLILTAILLPAAVLGASENEVNAAQKMAQYWVDSIAIEYAELAQWQGAVAIYPQPYENLDGDVNAYMFTIAGDKGIVGYILVGSSQYDYAIFEAGSVKPPARPSIDEACLAIEALGISTEGANLIKPVKLLYLGLDNQYALYNVNGQQVAVNLVFKNADSLSNLEPTLPSPSEYHEMIQQTSKRATRDLSGADSDLLTMYYYNDAGTNRVWCGPCSGVSILRYFRDYEGYSDLSGTDYVLYDLCYIYMDCASHNSSTLCTDYGDGIINTAG